MPKAMLREDWTARAEAYQEAAEHLQLAWTDDAKEREQGEIVNKLLWKESEKCRRIAGSTPERS